jgi:hypothetical protein
MAFDLTPGGWRNCFEALGLDATLHRKKSDVVDDGVFLILLGFLKGVGGKSVSL